MQRTISNLPANGEKGIPSLKKENTNCSLVSRST
jgi:hypothetical protein